MSNFLHGALWIVTKFVVEVLIHLIAEWIVAIFGR